MNQNFKYYVVYEYTDEISSGAASSFIYLNNLLSTEAEIENLKERLLKAHKLKTKCNQVDLIIVNWKNIDA